VTPIKVLRTVPSQASATKSLGYLSAAPRVSTRPGAALTGPRSHVLGVIRAFETLGWEVKPYIVGDRLPSAATSKGLDPRASENLVRSPLTHFVQTLLADLVRLGLGVLNSQRAWRELRGQVDWVYERLAVLQSLGLIFKRRGIPWILETNAPLFYEAKVDRESVVLSGLARWLEIRAYRKCDVLVCVSEALKEIVVRESGISPEKVIVVPNGVDTQRFDPERQEPRRVFAGFTVGFVGSLAAWQRLDDLLEVLRDLREEGLDLSLVVVGDGPMKTAWDAQAQRLGISSSVAFVGQVPWSQVPQYIAGFDLGYSGQASLQIGKMYLSPLKLYEYMAMAKPVVASAFEDAQRVVQEEETGFLFRAGNKDDLKGALFKAYHLPRTALPDMGRKARKEIVTHHSWEARVRKVTEDVERLLSARE
jgi:glycosyltransferase involved in cell wall biosynthesis